MEICICDLYTCIQRKHYFIEDEAKLILHDILNGVYYLLSLRILHRDLKSKNIF